MTDTTTTKRATRSGNPATKAAAVKETAASKRARIEAEARERAEQEERARKAQEEFQALVLPAPELDDDGYEIIPDRSQLEGQSYKFKVGGKAYVLPNLQYLPVNLALGGKTEEEVHAAVFGRYAPDLLDHCSADQMKHIFKRWMDYSKGVGLGE
jgi:hypothetical protein